MMTLLYTNPTKLYRVIRLDTSQCSQDWYDVFGGASDSFYILKAKVNSEKDINENTEYAVFRQETSFITCLDWLLENRIISKDEYKYVIEKVASNE